MNFLELTSYRLYLSSKRERKICRRMFNHFVYKTFPHDFSRRSRSVVVKEMYQKAWRMSVNSCCIAHITRRPSYLTPPPPRPTQYIHQQFSQYWCFVSNSQDLFTLHENSLCLTHDLLQCTCMASEVGISGIACGAGVFFGCANVLLAKSPCWIGLLFLLSLIFLRHNKDGGYNSTNINKQLSPAQNTPALQAISGNVYCGNGPINMKGVAAVYSLNKLKLRRRFIEEQVRIERLERRVSFIRWAFGYCVYLCYIGFSSMQKFLCSSPLPHYFAYFLFPSFCPFEYPAMNSLWCDPVR